MTGIQVEINAPFIHDQRLYKRIRVGPMTTMKGELSGLDCIFAQDAETGIVSMIQADNSVRSVPISGDSPSQPRRGWQQMTLPVNKIRVGDIVIGMVYTTDPLKPSQNSQRALFDEAHEVWEAGHIREDGKTEECIRTSNLRTSKFAIFFDEPRTTYILLRDNRK
jgi:hypothetical protein